MSDCLSEGPITRSRMLLRPYAAAITEAYSDLQRDSPGDVGMRAAVGRRAVALLKAVIERESTSCVGIAARCDVSS